MPGHTGPHGEALCLVRGQKGGRESLGRSFTGVSVKKTRQGRKTRLGLASLNDFSRLWGIGAATTCLVPGLELI